MKISIYKDGISTVVEFPKPALELQDILDRLHNEHDDTCVQFYFPNDANTLLPENMIGKELYMDIYRLNALINMYEQLPPEKQAAFVAVADRLQVDHPDDLLPLLYNLDTVPTIKVANYIKLGQFCIENAMLPEIEECPENLLPYLDRDFVGFTMAERNRGVFVGDYYCEPDHFECLNVSVKVGRPHEEVFLLLIGAPDDRQNAEWFSLPCDFMDIYDFADRHGMDWENLVCFEMQSALPQFEFYDMEELPDLNEVAWQLHDLSSKNVIKVKAIMEDRDEHDIAGLRRAIRTMDDYSFDVVDDYTHYARRYLRANLPREFNDSALAFTDLESLGRTILHEKHGLYSILPKPDWMQEQTESEDETETENCDPTWGGMT